MKISVIICAHNPDIQRLSLVLEHLKNQTLPQENWELLLIDNGSNTSLAEAIDLNWHFKSQIIREEKLGLTCARVRGIQESSGELLIFVDDDNLLAQNYLEEALNVSGSWPMIGVFGGEVELQFETPPPEWTRSYWFLLAFRKFERDVWSNLYDSQCLPCGAGMCVRKSVAQHYVDAVSGDAKKQLLDRRGANLSSSGDTDLAYTACDMGLGIGQTKKLQLKHVIPPFRVTAEYFLKLHEGMSFSDEILKNLRFSNQKNIRQSTLQKISHTFRVWRMVEFDKKMLFAEEQGRAKAQVFLQTNSQSHPD